MIYTFGVEHSDVLEKVPIDTSQIGADTTPISTGLVDEYIIDRSAQVHGVLAKGGILSPEDAGEITIRQAGMYIRTASALDVIDKMGFTDQQQRGQLAGERDRLWQTLSNPQLLRKRVSRSRSNVDENKPVRTDFTGDFDY